MWVEKASAASQGKRPAEGALSTNVQPGKPSKWLHSFKSGLLGGLRFGLRKRGWG